MPTTQNELLLWMMCLFIRNASVDSVNIVCVGSASMQHFQQSRGQTYPQHYINNKQRIHVCGPGE